MIKRERQHLVGANPKPEREKGEAFQADAPCWGRRRSTTPQKEKYSNFSKPEKRR